MSLEPRSEQESAGGFEDSVRRCESQIILSDRIGGRDSDSGERYCRSWLPAEPQRVMILVHGYAEHTGRYDEMAMYFARRGFAVHAYDQAGHGRTVGPRGHVDRFDRLVDEVDFFIERIALDYPGLPIVLVGHSMGGLVAAATAAFKHPAIDQLILSGALLRLGRGGFRQTLSLFLAKVLSFVFPRLGLSAGLDDSGLSRDPEVIRRYREDPYVKDRITARFAAGMNRMLERMGSAAGRIERPVLVLHGASDPICSPSGSQAFFAGLATPIAEKSQLKLYPELRHEIFQEPEREQIWDEMHAWITQSN